MRLDPVLQRPVGITALSNAVPAGDFRCGFSLLDGQGNLRTFEDRLCQFIQPGEEGIGGIAYRRRRDLAGLGADAWRLCGRAL